MFGKQKSEEVMTLELFLNRYSYFRGRNLLVISMDMEDIGEKKTYGFIDELVSKGYKLINFGSAFARMDTFILEIPKLTEVQQ